MEHGATVGTPSLEWLWFCSAQTATTTCRPLAWAWSLPGAWPLPGIPLGAWHWLCSNVAMGQNTLITTSCLKGNANDSMLKLWQWNNTTYTAITPGARPSTDSQDYYLWEEDLEIINQEEFKEMTLGDTFSHSEEIQMPWILTSQNMVPHGHARDRVGVFQMPGVQNGRMREIEMEWITRSFGGPSQAEQVNAKDHQPWGRELPDCIIRGYPMLTLVNMEVPYTVWLWMDVEATIEIREASWVYGHKKFFARKHSMLTRSFGMGTKVNYNLTQENNRWAIPTNLSKVA